MPYDEDELEPLTAPDTENRTHFHAEDLDEVTFRADSGESTESMYRRLAMLNTGLWNGKWENKEALHRSDNLGLFDAIASSMDLTDYQHRRARHLFDKFPLGTFGYEARIVAFVICVLVAEEDGREFDPTEKVADESDLQEVETDEQFHRVALNEGLHYGTLESVIHKIRDRFYKWGWR